MLFKADRRRFESSPESSELRTGNSANGRQSNLIRRANKPRISILLPAASRQFSIAVVTTVDTEF